MNVLLEIPFCLLLEIGMSWLGGDAIPKALTNAKTLLSLDSAMCNTTSRSSLIEVYQTINWEIIFTCKTSYYIQNVELKMKWLVSRKIKLTCLQIMQFPNHSAEVKSFLQWCKRSLKVLRLADFKGAMTDLTKTIAKECKALETLCLERCNLTAPIADILNKCATIKELRLQSRQYRRSAATKAGISKALYDKIACPGVVKLALLDAVPAENVSSILRAFPNVTDLELGQPSRDTLNQMLGTWEIHSLNLTTDHQLRSNEMGETILAMNHCSLRSVTLCTDYVNLPLTALQQMVSNCINLTSVNIGVYVIGSVDMVAVIAEHCNVRLEELRVTSNDITPAAVSAIATNCPNLHVFNVQDHIVAGEIDLTALYVGCPKLQRLRIRAPHVVISEPFVASIVSHCHCLEVLSLYMQKPSSYALLKDLQHCDKLHVVEIQYYCYGGSPPQRVVVNGVEVRQVARYSNFDELRF